MGKNLFLLLTLWNCAALADCRDQLVGNALSTQALTFWSHLDSRGQIIAIDRIADLFEHGQKRHSPEIEIKSRLRFLMQNLLEGHILPTDDTNWIPAALNELARSPSTDNRVRGRLEDLILTKPWIVN